MTRHQDGRGKLEELRHEITAVQAEIRALRMALLPLKDAERLAHETVERLGTADLPLAAFAAGRMPEPQELMPDATRVNAWLLHMLRDRLLTALRDGLTLFYTDPAIQSRVVPLAERPAKLFGLREKLASLERHEEQLVRELENLGVDCERRDDADPAIVLAPVLADQG